MSNVDFYHSFEDLHRGSRELIKSRLNVYQPFVEPLTKIYSEPTAVDLGCGRGEWLEVLTGLGFKAIGVDLNKAMLDTCHELGLEAVHQDAIEHLKTLPDESQTLVSGFHIAEHIPFEHLKILVEQALRVLKPAGLLILETPNPENIVVGTSTFYYDPTHNKPIPPALLSFIPQYYQYARIKVLRLQESPELLNHEKLELFQVLNGVSPDYAVVAQKHADEELLTITSIAFEKNYGVNLDILAAKYEERVGLMEARTQLAEEKAWHAEVNSEQTKEKAQHAEDKAEQAKEKARQAEVNSEQAKEKAWQAEVNSEQAKGKAQLAEVNSEQAKEKAWRAEVSSEQAKEKAQQAEANSEQAKEKAWHVEINSEQIKEKAQLAEVNSEQAKEKAQHAEDKAEQVKEIAHQAEVKSEQAKEKAQHAEDKAEQVKEIAHQAEVNSEQAKEKAQHAEDKAEQVKEIAHQAEVNSEQAKKIAQLAEVNSEQAKKMAQLAEVNSEQAKKMAQLAEVNSEQANKATQHTVEKIQQNTDQILQLEVKLTAYTEVEAAKTAERLAQAELKTAQAEIKIVQAELKATQAEIEIAKAETKLVQAELKASNLHADVIWQQKETLIAEMKQEQFHSRLLEEKFMEVQEKNHLEFLALLEKVRTLQEKNKHLLAIPNIATREKTELYQITQHLNSQLDHLYNSRSWKITRPLRTLATLMRKIHKRLKVFLKKAPTSSSEELITNSAMQNIQHEITGMPDNSVEPIDFKMLDIPNIQKETNFMSTIAFMKEPNIDWHQHPLSIKRTYQQLIKFAREQYKNENCN